MLALAPLAQPTFLQIYLDPASLAHVCKYALTVYRTQPGPSACMASLGSTPCPVQPMLAWKMQSPAVYIQHYHQIICRHLRLLSLIRVPGQQWFRCDPWQHGGAWELAQSYITSAVARSLPSCRTGLLTLSPAPPSLPPCPVPLQVRGSAADLQRELHRIDGKGYGAYRDLEGGWSFQGFTLFLDRTQSDPFAPPSRISIMVSRSHS